jgi:hypothetical protein
MDVVESRFAQCGRGGLSGWRQSKPLAAELALAEREMSAEPVTLTRAFFTGQRLAAEATSLFYLSQESAKVWNHYG